MPLEGSLPPPCCPLLPNMCFSPSPPVHTASSSVYLRSVYLSVYMCTVRSNPLHVNSCKVYIRPSRFSAPPARTVMYNSNHLVSTHFYTWNLCVILQGRFNSSHLFGDASLPLWTPPPRYITLSPRLRIPKSTDTCLCITLYVNKHLFILLVIITTSGHLHKISKMIANLHHPMETYLLFYTFTI